jgi:hypothetical protein
VARRKRAWRIGEIPGAQIFALQTPALVIKQEWLNGDKVLPVRNSAVEFRYPDTPPEGYRWEWTTVAVGSEENLDALADMLNKADARMF